MNEITIVEMRQFKIQIIGNLFVLKDFCKTFDIDLFSERFFVYPNETRFFNNTKIKQELINYFLPIRADLLTYELDLTNMKSVEEIASKINVDVSRVVAYIERIKEDIPANHIQDLSEYGDVTQETNVKNISSYKILKELHFIERQLLLSKHTNQKIEDKDLAKQLSQN